MLTGGWSSAYDSWYTDIPLKCIDSWTGEKLLVPIGGVVPYPKDVVLNGGSNHVILTPLSLLTLGQSLSTGSKAVHNAYDSAYDMMGLPGTGGTWGNGYIDNDPLVWVKSSKGFEVRVAVTTMVKSAMVLGTLTAARGLYQCGSGPKQLSDELFAEVSEAPASRASTADSATRCADPPCSASRAPHTVIQLAAMAQLGMACGLLGRACWFWMAAGSGKQTRSAHDPPLCASLLCTCSGLGASSTPPP
jgi:hypothetical protein